jgi:hypothetical protein
MKPYMVRMPEPLRIYLQHAAVDNRRSLNSEVVVRLEESKRREEAANDASTKGEAK